MKEQKLNNPLVQILISKGFSLNTEKLRDFNLEKFKEDISDLFSPFFDKEYIKENLSIPEDYIEFIKNIGEYLHNGWDYFHGEGIVLSDTGFWLNLYGDNFKERETTDDILRLHISIASLGDKQVILLNCDKSSKDVHKYYWFEDSHPWDEYSESIPDWDNLESYIREEYKA